MKKGKETEKTYPILIIGQILARQKALESLYFYYQSLPSITTLLIILIVTDYLGLSRLGGALTGYGPF